MNAKKGRNSRPSRNRALLHLCAYLGGFIIYVAIESQNRDSMAGYMRAMKGMFIEWSFMFVFLVFVLFPILRKLLELTPVFDPKNQSAKGYETELMVRESEKSISEIILKALGEIRPKRIEKRGEEIVAVTKVNLKTLGEIVTVDLSGSKEGRVRIASRPRCDLTLYDYGKNRANVEKVAQAIAEAIEPSKR